MQIFHETARQNDGQMIPLTRCKYSDILGNPMAASFHGWLHPQTIKDTLKRYRAIDNQIERNP